MPKTSIIGYSERGLVSSFLFGLACLPKSGTLINKIMLKAYGGKN